MFRPRSFAIRVACALKGRSERPDEEQKDRSQRREKRGRGIFAIPMPSSTSSLSFSLLPSSHLPSTFIRSSVHPFIRLAVCTTNDERFSRDCYRRVGYRRRDCGPMPDEERKFACSRAEAQTRKMTDGLPGSHVVPPSASRRHLESTKAAIPLDGSSPFIRVCCFQIATMERIVWKQCVATLETICF